MAETNTNNLAILIDADNVSSKIIAGLMAEVANYGTASVRRIYGDWTSPNMKSWRECLLLHSLIPVQQFAYTTGKNATDGAMIIDAMDLLYTGRFGSFCLVSSDSDFTRLAARIREQGITVYGFGHRNTNNAFVVACNKFVYFDALTMPSEPATGDAGRAMVDATSSRSPGTYSMPFRPNFQLHLAAGTGSQPRPLDEAALSAIRQAITMSSAYEDDFVNLTEVGTMLPRMSPDLVPRNYGYERLKSFVEASGIVELRMKPMGGHPPIALVRLKTRAPAAASRAALDAAPLQATA